MFTLGFSNLTTFLGVNTAPFAKTVVYPSTTQGRVLRVKDISGTTQVYGSLMLSTSQRALFDGKVSSLLFSTNTNTFVAITTVADGASNWVIKSAYTDMLIRAPPQPTDVSGLNLWFDANTIRGLTGQQIYSFGNTLSTMSGGRNRNEVFIATASNVGPLLQVSSLNGKNTLLFNNTSYNMKLSPVRYYDTMTFFAVSRLTNVTNARIWQGTQANIWYGYQGGLKNVLYMDQTVVGARRNANVTTADSNWDLLTVSRDSQGNAELFNYSVNQGAGIGYMGFQGLSINNGFVSESSTAEIAEWIVYNKKLSLSDQQRVEGYLAQKYGFTNRLPLTHPFTTQIPSTLGAPSTISNIPNLRLWFDATQLNASNGQKISSLSNLVGTGEVFGSNSATSTTWATFSTNQLNGYPILDFANTQIFYVQQPRKYPVFTMFSMTRMTPGGATTRYLLQGCNWSTWYGYGCNVLGSWVKNYYVTDNNIEIRGTAHTYTWDQYTFSRNSNSIARISAFGSNINKGYSQIGFEGLAINTGWDATNTSACQFAEVLLYDRELSADECSKVESYLAYKYGQTSNLYIPQPAVPNVYLQTAQSAVSTISSISSISNLKFWYDATQIPIMTHRYKTLKQTTVLPSNVSSLDCWYDASGVGNFLTNFSSIVIWYDKGSNARNLAQATQSNQPSYDSVNNRVWFNGVQQYLVFPTVPNVANSAFTVFMVEQRQTGTTWIFGGSNTNTNCNLYAGYNTSSNYYIGFYGNDFSSYTDYSFNNRFGGSNEPYRIWTIQYGSSNRKLYVNGMLLQSQTNIAPLTGWLGASIGYYAGNYYTGYMKEFIMYSNIVNDTDRLNIEGYLATKWGLQSNLVAFTPVSTMFNLTQLGLNMVASNMGDVYWMPTINSNAINGMNVLHFNCNNSMYQSNIRIYPSEFTMFTMARYTYSNGFSNSRSIFQGLTTGNTLYGYGTNVLGSWSKNYFVNDGNIEITGNSVDGNWNLHRFQRNSDGLGSLSVWGSNMNKGYIQSGFEGLGIHYGTTYASNIYFSDCDIAEIIIYDRALNPDEASKVESYIAKKYGLTSNLYVPIFAQSNQFTVTPQPLLSSISTISDITNLKFWFDPSQLSYIQHPYKTSRASANISSIVSISSLDCWFDASGVSNFSTNGSTIGAWYDKGPNARHLYQTVQSQQPTLVSSQNLVYFNAGYGQSFNFTTTPGIVYSDYTIFVVEQRQTSGNTYFIGGCNANTNQQFWMGYVYNATPPGTYAIQSFFNNDLSVFIENMSPRILQEPYRIWSAQYGSNAAVRRTFINGLMYVSQNFTTDLQSWSNAYVGRNSTGFYTGNMKEIIFYNRFLTDAERTQVEGYLAAKWNLVSSLTTQTPVSTLKNLTQLGSDLVLPYGAMCNTPLLITNPTLGNKNVLRFDTNRYMYQNNIKYYPTEYTMFTLSRHLAPYNGAYAPTVFSNATYLVNSRSIFQGLTTQSIYGYGSGSNGWAKNYFTNDGNVETYGSPVDSNWNLHRFQRQSDGMASVFYFGSNVNRGYTQSGFEGIGINYGAYSTSNALNSDCEVSEILIYDRNLTVNECTRVEQYLVNKYGLSTTYTQFSTLNYVSSSLVTISSLSSLTGLKLWFDPSQLSYIQHPYRFSTVDSKFSPSSISSLDTWYDASVSTSFSTIGSSIAVWYDLGFYGHHLYQSTNINLPRYVSSATIANNLVNFDGNSRFLAMSTTSGITCNDYSVYVVEQRAAGGVNYILGGSNNTNYQNFYMGYSGASNAYTDIYGNGLTAIVEPFVDYGLRGVEPYRIWCIQYSLASNYRYMYLNGQLMSSNPTVQDLTGWLNPAVGRTWPNGPTYYYNGNIKEIQFYTTALNTSTRQLIEGYLATKWNIQPNLMSNTPISTLKNLTKLPVDMLNNTGQLYNMPFLSTSALLGGKNVLRFDVNKKLFLGFFNSNAPGLPTIFPLQYVLYPTEFTLFYIARHIGSNGNNNRIILQGQNVTSYFGYTTNKKNYFYLDGNIEQNGVATNSNWDMWTFVKNRDGIASIAYFGSNINRGYTQSGFEGMAINTCNDTTNVSDCEVGEILLYDRAFVPSETSQVETYLANKYSLTSNLFQQFSNVPQPLLTNTVSSLTNIPDLKFWYDPTQIPIVNHPYSFSSPGINLSSITGLDCWFDASGVSNFSTFGSSIAVWYDKGSNYRHLLQSTIGNQPTFISSPTNAVNFNANTQFLTFSTIPGVVYSDYSIFMIEQVQSGAAYNMILGGMCNSNYMNLYMGYSNYVNTGYTFYQAQAGIQATSLAMNVPNLQQRILTEPYRIWSFQYSSNLQLRKLFINGYLIGTNTLFTTDLQSWLGASMGRFYNGNTYYYNGNIKEMLIYSNYVPDAQRQQIEGYLAWKWSVQANLNSNTPVSTMKNLTGTGADFINWQGNYCNMPFLTTNSTLTRQVLRFDSNMSMYQCNALFYENEFTIFTLSRHLWSNAQSNSKYVFLGLNQGIYGYGTGTNGYSKNYFTNDGNVETFGSPVDSNWNLHRFQRDSNGQGLIANFGQVINKGYLQSGFEGMGINYGAQVGTVVTTMFTSISDCEVSEILIYNRALTTTECVQVEQYIANKYSLGNQYTALSTAGFIVSTTLSTISSISDITGLRLWFDPSQINLFTHPYSVSTVGSKFTPSTISSLDGWFDASISTNFSTVGSTIAVWYDRGPNGRHLYQLISSFQPKLVSSLITGSNSVYFNGQNQFMTFNSNAMPAITCNDYTIFALEQRQAAYGANYFIGGSNTTNYGNLYIGYSGNSNIYTDIYAYGSMQPIVEPYNNRSNLEPFRIWCIQYSYPLKVRKIFINGTMMGSNYMTQDLTTWVSSGIGYYNTNFYTGNLKELMFYTSYLEDSQRQLVEGYLATKWSIQVNLMSNQPVSTLKNLTGLPVDMLNTTAQVMNAPSLCNSVILGNKNVLRFNTAFSNTLFLAPLNSNKPVFLGTTSLVNQIYPLQYVIYPTEFTLFYLSRHIGPQSNSRYIMQGQTMSAYYGYGNGYNGWCKNYFTNDGVVDQNGINNDSNWNLYSFTKLSNGLASYNYFGSNGNRGYVTSGFEGMAINMGQDTTNVSDCEVGEILVYNRALTTTETTRVEQYLANKYALSTTYTQFSTLNYVSSIMVVPSSLSTIANLKLWFDPSQLDFLRHPYNVSTVGTSFTPSTISSLDCWFDASVSTNYSTVGSTVAAWYDLGSNRRHLVQLVSTNQPLFISSISTFSNSIYFNGASQYMTFLTPPNIFYSDYTIMILEQRRSANANMYFIGGSNTTNYQNIQFGYNTASNVYYNVYGTGAMQINIETYTDYGGRQTEPLRIWSITYSSNTQTLRMHLNGHLMTTYYPYYNDMTGWIGAGVGLFWNGTSYYYTGNMKELAFFRTALPDDTRQLMEGYLATKWNIQGNLMSYTPISTLYNLTGMPANMINTTSQIFNMPFLSTSALLGGKNVLRFDIYKTMFLNYINSNTSYTYALQPVTYPNEFSLFYIARHINSNTTYSRLILQGNAASAYYGYNTAQKKGIFYIDGNWVEQNGFAANSNWDLWTFTKTSPGIASISYFGSNINKAYTGSGFDGMTINTGNDTTNISDCEVGEILLYDRALGLEECKKVETYLANKYSMTSNLLQPFSNVPQTLLTNVISSLSTIPDLKFWYDPTQVPIVRHPYNFINPNISPSSVAGLDCWYDASGLSNFSTFGSSISVWYDKGSNTRDLIQSTLSVMPTYVSSYQSVVSVSSQNAVYLNGSQYMYFSKTPAIINSDFTIFVVEQRQSNINNNGTNYMCFLGGCNSNAQNCNFNVGYLNTYNNWNSLGTININYTNMDYYQNAIYQPTPYYTRATVEPYRIWSLQYGSNAKIRRFFVNGFLHGNQSNFTTDIPQWLYPSLGLFNSNGSIYYYTGNMKEMIFYTTFMNDTQRQQIEGYLASKWGIQSNLNSNTPVSTLKNLAGTGADLISYVGNLCNYPALIFNPTLRQQVLRFNSNTQMYQCNALIYESDYTFFVLARQLCGPGPTVGPSNTGANCNIKNFIYGLNYGYFGYGSGYNGYAKNIFNADGTIENYGTAPDSNWDLFRFRRDSNGQGSLNYFGSNVNKGYLQSGFEGFGINYSYVYTSFNQGFFSDGEVGEILFYNRALSSNECTQVESYIANKYNLGQRLIQYSTSAVYASTTYNTISSLSTIPNLKLWFDPSQMNFLQHTYRYSTVGSNFSPSSISSLDAWYNASLSTNFTIASGSNISQWYDSTGRGRTLTQATASNQPFFNPGLSSISSSVYFNNTNFLSFTTLPNILSNDYTIFVVEQRQGNNVNNFFLGGSNTTSYGNLYMGYNNSNSAFFDNYGNGQGATIETLILAPSRFIEPWRIWCVQYSSNATARNLYINGQLLYTQYMYQDLLSWAGASVGLLNTGTSYFYTGYIKEIMFFSNALDTPTRQLMEGYLATKWNLQSNLMSNTPVSTVKNLTGVPVDLINTSGQLFNMPILSNSSLLGGKNVLRFIGSNTQSLFLGYLNSNSSNLPTLFPTPSLVYPNEYSLFYIARHLGCNTTYSRLILQGQTMTAYYGYNTAQKKNIFYNDGWIEVNGVSVNSNWDLWSFTRSNDGMAAIYYFGSNINKGYATSGFEGLGINTPDTTNISDCEVGEILVYDRSLNTNERNKVETYLATKYSITSNLQNQTINYPQVLTAAPAFGPSTLSSITNLKYWFDPGQLPILQHPYKISSVIGISPSTISTLDCWFDASGAGNFTLATSNVTRWIDKTGNGRDLIQASGLNQPIFSTNTQEVVFTGSGSQFLTFSNIPGVTNSDYTIFFLEKRLSNTVPNYFMGGSNTTSYTNLYMGYNTTSNFYFDHYGNGTQLTIDNYTSVAQEPYRLWTMAYSSNLNTRRMYLNGINYMTIATSNDLLSWTGASIGRFWNGTTYYYTGNVHEIIIYRSFLSDENRTLVEGYLAKRWNIQSNLTPFTPVSTLRNLVGIASDFTAQFASPCQLSNMPYLSYSPNLGYNVMSFTATTPVRTMQLCNNLLFPTEYTLFTVSRHTPGINKTIFQSITAPNTLYGYGFNPSNSTWVKNYYCNDGAIEVFGNPSNTLWDVNTFHRDSNGIATLFFYGSNFNRGYTQSGFEGLSINYGSYDTSCNSASECEVGEILIYDRALLSNERKSVEQYLTSKYGMTSLYNFYTKNQPYNQVSTISSISTLQIWLDASQVIASNGASISTVMNLTGLGGMFSNNTGANYPTLITNYQNNLNVLNITSGQQLWLTPSRIWENFSMFSITRQTGGTNKRVIQGTTGDVAYAYEGGYKNRYYLEQWQQQSMTASDTNWDLNNIIRTRNGFLSTVTWNGSTVTMSNPSTFLGLEGIGFNYCNTTAASDCQVGEVLVYNRPLLYPSEVQAVESYLATKWAIQRYLPVSHPGFLYQLSAYSGYNVQASSISTLCLWLDSSYTSTITTTPAGSNLVRWSDKMGIIASISQATTLYQPNYTTSLGPNFCNTQYLDVGKISSLVVASSFTMLFLERRQSTNTCNMILGGANGTTNNNLQVGYYNTSSFGFSFYNNDVTVQVSSFSNTQIEPPRIWSMTYDRKMKYLYMNGGIVSSVQTTSQDLLSYTAPTIGSNAATGTAYNGYLMEMLVYSPAATSTGRQLAEGYLAWKWGINSLLTSNHPWYSVEPSLPGTFYIPTAANLPNLLVWFDMSQLTGTNGATVANMAARIGSYTIQGSPTLTTAQQNGLNVMTFTTGQTALMQPTGITSVAWSLISLTRYTGGGNSRFLQCDTGDNYLLGYWNGQKNVIHINGWVTNSSGPAADTNWDINTIVFDSAGNCTFRNNGNAVATPNARTDGLKGMGFNRPNEPSNAQIGELYLFTSNIASSNYIKVEGYIAWKWGLQASLNASHPYKSYPPPM